MASITFTWDFISDEIKTATIEALARSFGWATESESTALNACRDGIREVCMQRVSSVLADDAAEIARQAALSASTQAIDTITFTVIEE